MNVVQTILTKEMEDKVFAIVQEYLNENRSFKVEKIIPYTISRLSKSSIDISSHGVLTILESFAKKNLIVEGSKFLKRDVLDNSNRGNIYSLIQESTGINFNRIAKKLDLRYQVLDWHLKMLLKFDYIKEINIDGKKVYFDSEEINELSRIKHIISKEKYKKLIDYLKNNDLGTTKTKLSKALKMHPRTVYKYLSKLEEFNLVFKEIISNTDYYFLNQEEYIQIKDL